MVNHRQDVRCVISLDQATGRDRVRATSGGLGVRRNLDNGTVINVNTQTVQVTINVDHVVKKRKDFSVFSVTYLLVKILIHHLLRVLHVTHQGGYVHNVLIVTVHQTLSVGSVATVRLGMSRCMRTVMR